MSVGLPIWAQWIQALGIPIVGILLSAIAAYIAWQQKRIADIRLQHDLYDRRYKVYDGIRKFLAVIMQTGQVDLKDFYTFLSETSDAVFLFKKEIADYLTEVREKSARLRMFNTRLSNQNLPQDQRAEAADQEAEVLGWFSEQTDVTVTKFKPYMKISRHRLKGS